MTFFTKPLTAAALILTTGLSPVFAQDGMMWQYHSSFGATVFETHLTAVYGVPESDGIQFLGQCAIGAGGPYMVGEFAANVGARPDGSLVDLTYIDSRGQSGSIPTTVVGTNREVGVSGVEFVADIDDPFWQMLRAGGLFSYSLPGGEIASMSLAGAGEVMGQLISDCANIGALPTGSTPPAFPDDVSCHSIFGMASQNGDAPQRVTFTNGGDGYRALFWMDYGGAPVFMDHLEPGQSATYDTYLTHPWMVTDGPGNCLEAMLPQGGNDSYMFTAANQFFGAE